MKNFFKNFKVSKKATTALITAVVIIFNENLGLNLDIEQVVGIVTVAIGYILGQAKVDSTLVDNGLKHK
jgi:hypothetical protein